MNGLVGSPRKELLQALDNFLKIYDWLQSRDPAARQNLKQTLKSIACNLAMEPDGYPQILPEYKRAMQTADTISRAELQQTNQAFQGARGGRICVEKRSEDDFRDIPVHPTLTDTTGIKVRLRRNKKIGEYEDADDYLDTQFRLLREDFITTIREGIKDVRKNPDLAARGKLRSSDCKVYNNFEIEREELTREGHQCVVRLPTKQSTFSTNHWLKSKKLIYGSLICLSDNNFREGAILFAKIVQRENQKFNRGSNPYQNNQQGHRQNYQQGHRQNYQQGHRQNYQQGHYQNYHNNHRQNHHNNQRQNQHQLSSSQPTHPDDKEPNGRLVRIQFLPESQTEYELMNNKKGPFMVVESSAYYESYHHVLRGLQNFNRYNLPFQQYIVQCHSDVDRPAYLNGYTEFFYQLPYKQPHNGRESYTDGMSVNDFTLWPPAEELNFNHSQYEAYKSALTQEFCVIQGPPGTGKTYVGLRVVKTLYKNLYCHTEKRRFFRHLLKEEEKRSPPPPRITSPLLVVCYTNHALDQFLEGILEFTGTSSIVRVGSRSQCEALEQCNITMKRKGHKCFGLGEIYSEKECVQKRYEKLSAKCQALQRRELIYDVFDLVQERYIFHDQLLKLGPKTEIVKIWLVIDTAGGKYQLEQFTGEQCRQSRFTDDTKKKSKTKNKKHTTSKPAAATESLPCTSNSSDTLSVPSAATTTKPGVDDDDDTDEEEHRRIVEGFDDSEPTVIMDILDMPRLLVDDKAMSEDEVDLLEQQCKKENFSIWELPCHKRWRLYRYCFKQCYDTNHAELKKCLGDYNLLLGKEQDLKNQRDIRILQTAEVIGMTTTGAARIQSVLQQVKPKIVVVEEAAEVLEAHIITALSQHCEHLILIGDHKQLKPNPTVYELAKEYHLDLSLFERMVNNGLPVKTLNIQHRMRPEVSKFMRHIYDRLDDHKSVQDREAVRGLPKSVFFFNHQNLESVEEGLMSKSNLFEADMVVALARYLTRQAYSPSEITIITMYKGQEIQIRNRTKRDETLRQLKVSSVDNFQGEENDIIIVSLVRSNKEEKLGFVNIENRVCVTLSRAKYGMYVFGNFDMICKKSEIWSKMVADAKSADEFGEELNLSCVQHSVEALVKTPTDFDTKAPSGGCTQMCNAELSCGHKCTRSCHYWDIEHKQFACQKRCEKKCAAGLHPCKARCYRNCPPCDQSLTKELPCSHEKTDYCCRLTDLTKVNCLMPCEKKLECGHLCQNSCSMPHTQLCKEPVEKMCSVCEDITLVLCSDSANFDDFVCRTPCTHTLECGHRCTGTCTDCRTIGHALCNTLCGTPLKCGHACSSICSVCYHVGHPPCEHSHTEILKCQHKFVGTCSEWHSSEGSPICESPCGKDLICGHKCTGKCGLCATDGCPKCEQTCILKCSHDERCTAKCYEPCTYPCNQGKRVKRCDWGCTKHGTCKLRCGEPCRHDRCDHRCSKNCSCPRCGLKYICLGACGQPCPDMCKRCDRPDIGKALPKLPNYTPGYWRMWIKLADCKHILPINYMDKWVDSSESSVISCPFPDCKKRVLNTGRYINKTRSHKYEQIRKAKPDSRKRHQREGEGTPSKQRRQPEAKGSGDPNRNQRLLPERRPHTERRSHTERQFSIERLRSGRYNETSTSRKRGYPKQDDEYTPQGGASIFAGNARMGSQSFW